MPDFVQIEPRGNGDFWFACVDLKVIRDKTLTPCDKAVFAVICAHVDIRTRSTPLAVKTIAEEAGCGIRTAQKSIAALVERGVLERVERFRDGRQITSAYRIVGHRADCYRTDDKGAESAGYVENDTPGGADSAHRESEPGSYENQKTIPPLPPERGERERESFRPQELLPAIVEAYHAILPELPRIEKITKPRIRALWQRIREDPEREKESWWRLFFSRVREYPWPMGQNPDGWRATFDWLVAEKGMQKILEGAFSSSHMTRTGTENGMALQRKYTNAEGEVDAKALLRDL